MILEQILVSRWITWTIAERQRFFLKKPSRKIRRNIRKTFAFSCEYSYGARFKSLINKLLEKDLKRSYILTGRWLSFAKVFQKLYEKRSKRVLNAKDDELNEKRCEANKPRPVRIDADRKTDAGKKTRSFCHIGKIDRAAAGLEKLTSYIDPWVDRAATHTRVEWLLIIIDWETSRPQIMFPYVHNPTVIKRRLTSNKTRIRNFSFCCARKTCLPLALLVRTN